MGFLLLSSVLLPFWLGCSAISTQFIIANSPHHHIQIIYNQGLVHYPIKYSFLQYKLLLKEVSMLHQMKGGRLSIPLVSHEEQGFKLHEEALEFLSTVPSGKKIHVLSIVGKVKTGKSYLLNKLVHVFKQTSDEEQEYFPISNNLNDCTKGISILTSWIQTNDSVIIVLDMEGLGSLANTTGYDSKLFAIGMLLSSTIIYNNVGPIDEQALQNLSFLIEIGKLFDKSMPDSLKGLGLPSMFMVLRDFSLTFENKEGAIVTSKQYLQNCLQEQKGLSEAVATKNRIRRVIKSLFTCRNCQSLILPSEDLPITFKSQVRVQFLEELDRLSGKLLAQIYENPKRIKSQLLNSSQYVLYIREFMDSFNSNGNSIPRIDNILVQVYRKQTNQLVATFQRYTAQIRREYQDKIDALSTSSSYRLSSQYLDDHRDDSKIQLTQKIIVDCQTWKGSIRSRYLDVCKQMEALIKNQGNYDIAVSLQYENSNIIKIKQFKELFETKSDIDSEISAKIRQLQEFVDKERSRLRKKQDCEEEIQKLKLLVDQLSIVESEKQLESKYMEFIGSFKDSGRQLSSSVVQNYLLKLEVTYLRRKLELKDRKPCTDDSPIRIEDQGEDKKVLQDVSTNILKPSKHVKASSQKQNHFQTKMIETLASFASRQICFNQSQFSRQLFVNPPVLPKQAEKPFCSFQNAKSFYVPYVIISDVQTMNVEIVRTLIKQDSKRTNYVQYVLEVVLVHKRWIFSRKWKDFCELNNILHNLFQKALLPPFEPSVINPTRYMEESLLFKQEQIETRRHKLEIYLRKLLAQEQIRNSRIMQKFLKINKQYITTL